MTALVKVLSLPSAVVVDVGFIVGRDWAVIEFNAAWSIAAPLDRDPPRQRFARQIARDERNALPSLGSTAAIPKKVLPAIVAAAAALKL